MNRRILILQEHLFADTGANSKLIFALCSYLHKIGYDVSILGIAHDPSEHIPEYNGIHLIHEPADKVNAYYHYMKNVRCKWSRFVQWPRSIVYRMHHKYSPYYVEMYDWLKHHVNEYDVLIACCSPYYPLALAARFANRIPVIYYKLDSVSTILYKTSPDSALTTVENEIAWDNVASRIIMTDVVFREYNQLPTKVNAHKVIVANYPSVHKRTLSTPSNAIADTLEKDKINLFFVGKLYANIRHPQYLFDIMEQLQDTPIVLHIVGPVMEMGFDRAYMDKYFTNRIANIRVHGAVSPREADDLLLHADILVHIGNTLESAMPSKILDYISSGKPILNICKIRTCPTIPLMERYPMGLTIFEDEGISELVSERIKEFCLTNKGKQVPYEEIEKIYHECTIEYVGKQFDEAIQDAIKEFKQK